MSAAAIGGRDTHPFRVSRLPAFAKEEEADDEVVDGVDGEEQAASVQRDALAIPPAAPASCQLVTDSCQLLHYGTSVCAGVGITRRPSVSVVGGCRRSQAASGVE